jgi:hypothetical protein
MPSYTIEIETDDDAIAALVAAGATVERRAPGRTRLRWTGTLGDLAQRLGDRPQPVIRQVIRRLQTRGA